MPDKIRYLFFLLTLAKNIQTPTHHSTKALIEMSKLQVHYFSIRRNSQLREIFPLVYQMMILGMHFPITL
ncbi:hypothetical protein D3C84_884430 [compost metagenome]